MTTKRSNGFTSLLTLLLVGLFLVPVVGHAAVPQTAQEKYDALVEAGIFEGFPDGEAHLDKNMTRAQAAKIVTMVLGLEQDASSAAVYKDLKDAEWAAGYIGAATEAGILNGRGNGIFDPTSNVTIQELSIIMVKALDLEIDEDATVEGASAWAQKYVAAALQAGVIPAQDDYTQPASRELLVEVSYVAQEVVETKKAEEQTKEEEKQKEEAEKQQQAVDSSVITSLLIEATQQPQSQPEPQQEPQKLATPNADQIGGSVPSGTQVTLAAASGATIYYTTDGTDPNTSSLVYNLPIVVNSNMTIKAIAVQNGMLDSDILTLSFTVQLTGLALINYELENGMLLIDGQSQVNYATFTAAGLTGLTENNWRDFKYYLESSISIYSIALPADLATYQGLVDEFIEQETVTFILEYLAGMGMNEPTVDDFIRIGASGVNESNIEDVLQQLISAYADSHNPFSDGTPMSSKDHIVDAINQYLGV